jgi:hypothetical protein
LQPHLAENKSLKKDEAIKITLNIQFVQKWFVLFCSFSTFDILPSASAPIYKKTKE